MEEAKPASGSRRSAWRILIAAAAVGAVLAATGLTAYRIFAPAEVVTEATRGYPAASPVASPGVIGTLAAAPLIVDGRLRVYATTRQIRADAPVDARTQRSPLWSYRRWPAQVVGVVATGTTVVGRWSDGQLIAIDGRTGTVAWRARGPRPQLERYAGRRTGAATVYAPDGLYTAGPVVIAASPAGVVAVDAADGRVRWRSAVPVARGCPAIAFTTAGGGFVVAVECVASLTIYAADTGRVTSRTSAVQVRPQGCRVGRSECVGMTTGAAGRLRGWLLRGPAPVSAPGLAAADAWLVPGDRLPGGGATGDSGDRLNDLAVAPAADGLLVARRADTAAPVWTWQPGTVAPSGRARVIAVEPGRVHLLTAGYFLVTVDAGTGVEVSRFLFTYGRERTGWVAGHAYASGSFVLVERLAAGVDPAAPDGEYYFIAQPVLLAGT